VVSFVPNDFEIQKFRLDSFPEWTCLQNSLESLDTQTQRKESREVARFRRGPGFRNPKFVPKLRLQRKLGLLVASS
jgi:hypothetical protein